LQQQGQGLGETRWREREEKRRESNKEHSKHMLTGSKGEVRTNVTAELKVRTTKLRIEVFLARDRCEGAFRVQFRGPAVRGESMLHR